MACRQTRRSQLLRRSVSLRPSPRSQISGVLLLRMDKRVAADDEGRPLSQLDPPSPKNGHPVAEILLRRASACVRVVGAWLSALRGSMSY